jgi:DnaJ-class molecular chaperone
MTIMEWFCIQEVRIQQGWKRENCYVCYGTGQTSSYSWNDFIGPEECDRCAGSGQYWVTPKGRHVLYPGGPFV